jgi:hypothetical protein
MDSFPQSSGHTGSELDLTGHHTVQQSSFLSLPSNIKLGIYVCRDKSSGFFALGISGKEKKAL